MSSNDDDIVTRKTHTDRFKRLRTAEERAAHVREHTASAEEGTVALPWPDSLGIELYTVDEHEGTFGARVILPEGRTHEMYSSGNTFLTTIECAVTAALRNIGMDEGCVEIIDFDGSITDTTNLNMLTIMKRMVGELRGDSLRDHYNKLKADGVLPPGLDFETFEELESEGGGSIH
jgi:hypothetical protein